MHGVFNLLKPPGMTSHDAVAVVRRATGIKRVGHTGTLDPAAAGVLPICIGQATRFVEYLQAGTKFYTAEMTFGYETDTLDAVGTVISEASASHVNLENLRPVLDEFRGTIQQMPPLYSAIKQDGKKLYELARAGVNVEDVEIKAREVTISQLVASRFQAATADGPPCAMLNIECSSGTYIRSLVRDIGRSLGCGATMTFLIRTRSGSFHLGESRTIEQITQHPTAALIPAADVLRCCAEHVIIDNNDVEELAHGRRISRVVSPLDAARQHTQNAPLHWKLRKISASHNQVDPQRVLFLNHSQSIAVLAYPASPETPNLYQPEKVFHLADN